MNNNNNKFWILCMYIIVNFKKRLVIHYGIIERRTTHVIFIIMIHIYICIYVRIRYVLYVCMYIKYWVLYAHFIHTCSLYTGMYLKEWDLVDMYNSALFIRFLIHDTYIYVYSMLLRSYHFRQLCTPHHCIIIICTDTNMYTNI
jgi:hypothetical protein